MGRGSGMGMAAGGLYIARQPVSTTNTHSRSPCIPSRMEISCWSTTHVSLHQPYIPDCVHLHVSTYCICVVCATRWVHVVLQCRYSGSFCYVWFNGVSRLMSFPYGDAYYVGLTK